MVNLNATYSTVNVYGITVGATPVATYSNVNSVPLTLRDHVSIVEFKATAITSAGFE
jgi:hypothetical protein